ncbi:hypothetical protein PAHAL_3G068300 [Panicum hallii]|uniref:Uncharacterized protein n=1 Tax=Panicum hallii TaxID=206008 RepID=A0A2T8KHC9_9POAL|nr:hypothetical protein PAHAL_3G068300 [Panicum hallii]
MTDSLEGWELGAALLEAHGAAVPGRDGGDVHQVVASLRGVPPEVDERHEQRHEQHQVVQRVPLPHALVRPGAERQEVAPERHVLPALLREEPARVERRRVPEPLERRLVQRREHGGAPGHRVPLRQPERLAGDVRHHRRRGPVTHHLPRHSLGVPHLRHLSRGDGLSRAGRPERGHLGADAGEHVRRAHQPRDALLGAPEREVRQVHGHRHEPDVEQVVVPCELLPPLRGEVRPHEHRLRGLQVHVAAGHPQREGLIGVAAVVEPPTDVGDDDALLDGGVGGERARREVGRDPAAELPVVVAEHVDEVVVAEELLAEGVADEVEGVGADVGEHAVGELRVADEDDEPPEEVVRREAERRRLGARRQPVPVRRRVADHLGDAPEEWHHERGAGQGPLLAPVGQLLHHQVVEERHGHGRDQEPPPRRRHCCRCKALFWLLTLTHAPLSIYI